MLCIVEMDIYFKYMNDFYKEDLKKRFYNKVELMNFLATIIDFIEKKKNKLRIRTDLKISRDKVFGMIFSEVDITSFSDDLKFWMRYLLDFYFAKYDIFDDIDNIEENYISMYDEYLRNYDLNNVN